ncbi:MAG: sodium:solute symporter family protein [Planctomycetia bacterium]|nr:sodium:solute symporter family protein [Planctomycetia bacterium]
MTSLFAAADQSNLLPLIATGVFFIILLGIAAWGMTKTKTTDDFFLGGRTLGPWILGISYGTAYFSAVVFIGFAGQYGWLCSYKSFWAGIMNGIVGSLLAWLVLGKPTRTMTRRLNASTMPEFFVKRFQSNGMKIFGALIIFIFLLPYSAGVFAGLTYLFQEVFHVSMTTALTVVVAITGLYLVFGGYKATARIDFLQGMIMFFGVLVMVIFVLRYFSGIEGVNGVGDAIAKSTQYYHERLEGTRSAVQTNPFKPIPGVLFWSVVFMTSVSPWGMPQMVHKYYAIKDEKQIKIGAVICCVFALLVGGAAYFIGAFSHLLPEDVLQSTLLPDQSAIDVQKLVPTILVMALPNWFLAIVLLLILSASMSTLCALALTSSAALSIDLFKGYIAPKAPEKTQLHVFRICCAIFIVLSYLVALNNPTWIVALTSLCWGVVCGSFMAPYMYGIFWRGTTKAGAIAGMASGALISNALYWGVFFHSGAQVAKMYSPLIASIAMVAPFLVVPVVSLCTKKYDPEFIANAFDKLPDKQQVEASAEKNDAKQEAANA